MKRYVFVFIAGLFIAINLRASSFSQDTPIRVYGKILNAKDSSSLSVTVLYEKLPYYDDMGMAVTKTDGSYEFLLIKGTKYNIRVDKIEGYEPIMEELIVVDNDGDLEFTCELIDSYADTALHTIFSSYSVDTNGNIFKMDVKLAIELLKTFCKEVDHKSPEADVDSI